MPLEIEKKYLISPQSIGREIRLDSFNSRHLVQAYLASSDFAVIRVRLDHDRGLLSIKQRGSGIKRIEVERELTLEEANELLTLCPTKKIEKQRYFIPHGSLTVELDVFLGDNKGLIVAEVEFANEEDASSFEPPEWFSTEVSGDVRYYNHYLSEHPFATW